MISGVSGYLKLAAFCGVAGFLLAAADVAAQQPAPAPGWEPSRATTPERMAEVRKWQKRILGPKPTNESRAALNSEILKHAKRAKTPAWTNKTSWSDEDGKAAYWYGVGAVRGIKNEALAITTAENRARAEVGKLRSVNVEVQERPGERRVKISSATTMSGVVTVDWFVAADGTVFALAVKHWPDGPPR